MDISRQRTTPPPMFACRLILAPHPRSVGRARRQASLALMRWGLARLVDTVAIVLSELVTNAVQAVESWSDGEFSPPATIRVRITPVPGGVRLRVFDPVPKAVLDLQIPDDDDESGRGLFIVAAMCADWGVVECGTGKCFWGVVKGDLR